jgi:hypothetical protein
MTWREQARKLKRDVVAIALAMRDPRVPWYAKALGACVVALADRPDSRFHSGGRPSRRSHAGAARALPAAPPHPGAGDGRAPRRGGGARATAGELCRRCRDHRHLARGARHRRLHFDAALGWLNSARDK